MIFFCWEYQFISGNTDCSRMVLHYAIIRSAQLKVFCTFFCSYEKNSEPLILHSLKRLKTWSTITRNLWKGMCCMSDSWDSYLDSLESMLIYPQRINQRWLKLEWKTKTTQTCWNAQDFQRKWCVRPEVVPSTGSVIFDWMYCNGNFFRSLACLSDRLFLVQAFLRNAQSIKTYHASLIS